ncbi:phage major capsid protein, HK97 family [Octadecabacter temperatus]|uniref:Phage capsid family protein n=1 Tax=Octadecabacter temperatus TaxID=1458307 RepID=A0A0K0Y6L6_9RHOB|nr:phage major capsid protein [Octadecabacter temperatus]AKS46492.1 Phage capsid family protein [Octadecabacter temperatus]SIO15114.1 phage major capsid protein, HK97 family [Octadecabacter temperatus]
MTKPECKARDGEGAPSPAHELKAAMAGFVSDFKDFTTDIQTKLKEQDDRMTKLDRKSMISGARPALATAASVEAPHQKAFEAYLRSGEDDGLRDLPMEGKSMSTAVAADGGYLVDPQTSATVQSTLAATASIRAIANVVNVEATSYDVLIDHTEMGAGWATENDPSTETGTPQIDRITIALHELSALPKASQRLLDDSAFNIDEWLAGRIADKFARSEAAAFVNGNGVDKPTGFLTAPQVDNDVWVWGNLGYVVTGADGDFNGADSLIDLVYGLGAEYRANGTFVMNSKTAGAVRKLKDNDGRFLWSDGLVAGEPARLLGYPVLIAEDMPDIGTDATAIAFGDFGAGYTVAERPDLRVLRDPFSAKPHVLFYATKRVGGAVSDFAAIKLLKFGLS